MLTMQDLWGKTEEEIQLSDASELLRQTEKLLALVMGVAAQMPHFVEVEGLCFLLNDLRLRVRKAHYLIDSVMAACKV